MLHPGATLHQIKHYLTREIAGIFHEGETTAMVKTIMEHTGYPFPVPFLKPETIPAPKTIAQINEIVADIHTRKPIQYILGKTHFCDLELQVNENVLIPRPETEEMIAHISRDPGSVSRMEHIIDIGTGSGCIALALKKRFPAASVTGIDAEAGALEVSRANGTALGLEVNWLRFDITDHASWNGEMRFDLVVSNPPYIPESERKGLDPNVKNFEPPAALYVTDREPLKYYHALAAFCNSQLNNGGHLWVEVHERFGREVCALLREAEFPEVKAIKDIHGKDRFVHAVL